MLFKIHCQWYSSYFNYSKIFIDLLLETTITSILAVNVLNIVKGKSSIKEIICNDKSVIIR